MARKLDDLIIGLQLTTKALEQGMNEVKKKLNSHTAETKRAAKGYDELAIVAGFAFAKIVSSVSSGVKAFNDYRNAMVGLKSIAAGTGASFAQAQEFMDSFTKDGLIPASNAATALKNLLARGFSMGEAADIMSRFKDSAAFGRQAALSLGEAVQSATEGIKNENSILVDNAGVTKNVSVMWKEYAATLNKSVDSLTIAEKRQAEYAGIMKETQHQVGDAAKYAKEFSGAQAKAAAETLKLQQALGGAMVPTLGAVLNLVTPLISLVTELIEQNPILSATLITMITTLAALATGIMTVVSALKILKPAITAVTAVMASNPVILAITVGLTALVGIITAITAATQKAKKEQEEYNDSLDRYNKLRKDGITRAEVPQIEEEAQNLEKLIEQYDRLTGKYKEMRAASDEMTPPLTTLTAAERETGISADKLADAFFKLGINIDIFAGNTDEARKKVERLRDAIRDANRVTLTEYSDQAKVIAQKRQQIMETENLIKAYKNAEKGSSDWEEAQQKLAEQFPQFSTASGIMIDAINDVTEAQNDQVEQEWKNLQDKIRLAIAEVNLEIMKKEAILATSKARLQAADDISGRDRTSTRVLMKWGEDIAKQTEEIEKQKRDVSALQELLDTPLEKITGIKPPKGGNEYERYENEALESALRIHNHQVKMGELTKEQELANLEAILKAHAKTAEERMDLEERIYDVKQELRERDLAATEKAIEDEAKKLADRTANSERIIAREKLRGEMTPREEINAYNSIIGYHKRYLDRIKADTKISQDEKERIIAEETRFIEDQQDKIFEITKAATEKAVNAYIEAKRRQYDTEETLENERLNEKLKALDKEYAEKEKALRGAERATELESLYAEERKYQNAATKEGQERLKSIREQIAALLKEEERERLDAEKQTKREAIEQEIADNQKKYRQLRDDLETAQKEMLAAAVDFANESTKALEGSAVNMSLSLRRLFSEFEKNNDSMMSKGLEKLRNFVKDYKKLMNSITLKPEFDVTPSGSTGTKAAKAGTSVTVNDYGDKIINSKDETVDYTKELFNTAENAARLWGGTI
jgi:DNA repair exonuclease SbcCD ATPase subunit